MDLGTQKTPADKYSMLVLRSDTSALGSGNAVVEMKSDGSALFNNRIDLNGGVTVDGGASMSTGFYYRNDSGTEGVALYKDGANSANRNVHIKTDGTSSFAGQMQIGKDLGAGSGARIYSSGALYLRSDVSADNSIFKYYNGGFGDANVRINFKADGTGYFVGGLYAGGRDTSSTTAAGVDANGTGSLYIQGKGTTTDGATVFQYSRGTDSANIKFTANGNASFGGKVTSASTTSADNGATLATKDYVDTHERGGDTTIINYNGASSWGSVAADGTIEGSLNVGSVTKTGTGVYQVVFTNPMPNADYSVTTSTPLFDTIVKAATGFTISLQGTNNPVDGPFNFAVFALNALPPRGGTGADSWGSVNADGSTSGSFNCTVSRTNAPDGTVYPSAVGFTTSPSIPQCLTLITA